MNHPSPSSRMFFQILWYSFPSLQNIYTLQGRPTPRNIYRCYNSWNAYYFMILPIWIQVKGSISNSCQVAQRTQKLPFSILNGIKCKTAPMGVVLLGLYILFDDAFYMHCTFHEKNSKQLSSIEPTWNYFLQTSNGCNTKYRKIYKLE